MTSNKKSEKFKQNEKLCGILTYFLAGIIWYFVDEEMKKSKFVKFHVKQALILLIANIIISVAGSIIPFIGWFIILPLGSLFILILWIIGIISAINGKEKELPIIGKYAEKVFQF